MAGAPKLGAQTVYDGLPKLLEGIASLTKSEVLVGVPEDKAARQDGGITNAQLAYIHSKGAPEANIPARPFMEPGIARAKDAIAEEMKAGANAALAGKGVAEVERFLGRAGQIAVNSAQAVIRAGIPPPLKPATIAKRRIRSAGSKYRRKATSANETTPLWDTGQLLRAITWVIRKARRR